MRKLLSDHRFEPKQYAQSQLDTISKAAMRRPPVPDELLAVARCLPSDRCGRDGCPRCLRKFRKGLCLAAHKLGLAKGVWTAVSVIPDGLMVPRPELHNADLRPYQEALLRRLGRSTLSGTIVIGGWDISLNKWDNEDIGWQPHLYLLFNHPKSEEFRQQVLGVFELSPDALRPIHIKPINVGEFLSPLTYSQKFSFNRRSGYQESDRQRADGSARSNSRNQALSILEKLEIVNWLAKGPVGNRLIMRNLKRISPPGAKVRLKLLKKLLTDSDARVVKANDE